MFITQEVPNASQPVIFNPDFFVERLKHEHPHVFTDLVLSNITRLIDLPGDEFSQLIGDSDPKIPAASGFLRSLNFLKRKGENQIHWCPSRWFTKMMLCVIHVWSLSQSQLEGRNNVLYTLFPYESRFQVIAVKYSKLLFYCLISFFTRSPKSLFYSKQ